VQNNSPLIILTAENDWYFVRTQAGLEGWIWSPLINIVSVPTPTSELVTKPNEFNNGVEVYPELAQGTDILVVGSSYGATLVWPLEDQFISDGFSGNVNFFINGTGDGFQRFCLYGEGDVMLASRPINPDEIKNCEQLGREFVTFDFGEMTDGNKLTIYSTRETLSQNPSVGVFILYILLHVNELSSEE
jgi:hypothetical protein